MVPRQRRMKSYRNVAFWPRQIGPHSDNPVYQDLAEEGDGLAEHGADLIFPRGNFLLQLFKPVQHDVDLRWCGNPHCKKPVSSVSSAPNRILEPSDNPTARANPAASHRSLKPCNETRPRSSHSARIMPSGLELRCSKHLPACWLLSPHIWQRKPSQLFILAMGSR